MKLEEVRKEIDAIDRQLLPLFLKLSLIHI